MKCINSTMTTVSATVYLRTADETPWKFSWYEIQGLNIIKSINRAHRIIFLKHACIVEDTISSPFQFFNSLSIGQCFSRCSQQYNATFGVAIEGGVRNYFGSFVAVEFWGLGWALCWWHCRCCVPPTFLKRWQIFQKFLFQLVSLPSRQKVESHIH